jgi:hypothetical protein
MIYYGPSEYFDFNLHTFENPNRYQLLSNRVIIDSNSIISVKSLGTFRLKDEYYAELNSEDASAFIELNLELSYILDGGNSLPPRQFYTTLFF